MRSKNLLIVVSLLTIVFTPAISSQQRHQILFGTYLASSNFPEITYHQFNDSNLVRLGFNTILQTVMHPVIHNKLFTTEPLKWHDNRVALGSSSFSNIVALNGYWNKEDEQQVDWVKILTHGAYNKWEVEGGNVFQSEIIKMEWDPTYTDIFYEDGIVGVKTRTPHPQRSEIVVVSGPGMYQDPTYKVEHRFDADYIPYYADFRMKIGMIPAEIMDVCSLRVWVNYPVILNNVVTWNTKTLSQISIRSDELSDEFANKRIFYQISGLGKTTELEPEYISQTDQEYVLINSSKIYYEVIIPDGVDPSLFGHLFIDYIEVSESQIWGENGDPNQIEQLLGNYNDIWDFEDVDSVYRDKIKYFYTMDEPHSYDHFLPYREVEAVQKTLSGLLWDKMMLTKIYPEWTGEKEGNNVIRTWNREVNPRKSMFWYYTIFNQDISTISGQIQLRTRFEEMVDDKTDFYFTAQTFGQRNLRTMGLPGENAHYYKYRTPTGRELLGQTMQALSYGCKGVFYETYYSYKSEDGIFVTPKNPDGLYFAESLVGIDTIHYNVPRLYDYGLYDTIKSIGARLRGPLGRTLSQLEIEKNGVHATATHIYYTPSGEGYWDNIGGSLVIYGDPLLNYPPLTTHFINFGATKLKPKMDSKLKGSYYFLHNANTFDEVDLGPNGVYAIYDTIKIGLKVTGYTNWVLKDIESETKYRFIDTSTTGFDLVQGIYLNKGDGKLFRLFPTIGSSGLLLQDEIIPTDAILSTEGTITVPDGVTLKIEGNYTLTDSLIIEDGGVLTLEPGSTLNLDSASSVYCAGDIYVNGTATNKVTINFLQSNETNQNSIYLGRESSAIIKYAEIKNGYSGITATNGFDTLIIDNCNFTNISRAALLLNGAGYDKTLITNNTYTNCDYAGFFFNLSTVVINTDSANTRSGYCFLGVSDLWFGNNTLTGTQEGVGLTLTGSFGNIYNNKITNHTDGILLANSFPKIGGNEITNNTQRGLVCEYGSTPDLETFSEVGDCEQMNTYPLSGFNTIFDNGGEGNDEMNAEIFLDNSSLNMSGGTNAVVDDGSEAIIAGKCTDDPLDLSGNYWGSTGVESTTFNLGENVVNYIPQVTTFSPIVSTECPFIINLNTLSFSDTLHRINNGVPGTG